MIAKQKKPDSIEPGFSHLYIIKLENLF